jgi:hypothetical protein
VRLTETIFALIVVAGFGAGTALMLAPNDAARLRAEKEDLARQQFALEQCIQRLTDADRVAEVHVVEQRLLESNSDASRPRVQTTLEFIELDREQHPLPSRRFVIDDEVIYFDALVVKFSHENVAAGDALRGKSLALFRRVYGEGQQPSEGQPIDPQGDVPNIFRVHAEPSEFEQQLWTRFWDYARDPELAAAEGVRIAQGEAVYVPMREGDVWALTLQHNGGLNIKLRRSARDGQGNLDSAAPPVQ